ncbi:DNA cytosine methyltransferase, partial [Pseudomonas sp. HMWF021]|uniref:DNA cytosine methyltransferase n=1 Tax=Pseudomonas sp. HMWF021 TaxID=2056857 RepID=UPI000D4870AF
KKNRFKDSIKAEFATPAKLRDVLISVGKIGSPSNSRLCNAKITAATSPIMRRSPYAGMLFNGQGRPMNLDGHSATLPASMGGNRTPIIDNLALYENHKPWIEEYHAHLTDGGSPAKFGVVPPRLRRLTVDEALAIQTFPKDYNFSGGQSSVFKQIGNAVPCNLAAAVAKTLIKLIKNETPHTQHINSGETTFELELEPA